MLEGDRPLLKRVASAKLGFPGRASRPGGRSVILADGLVRVSSVARFHAEEFPGFA